MPNTYIKVKVDADDWKFELLYLRSSILAMIYLKYNGIYTL